MQSQLKGREMDRKKDGTDSPAVQEVMGISEVAEFLRMNKATTYKLAKAGQIPGRRIGGVWRFNRVELIEWLKGDGGDASAT